MKWLCKWGIRVSNKPDLRLERDRKPMPTLGEHANRFTKEPNQLSELRSFLSEAQVQTTEPHKATGHTRGSK